MQIYRQTRRERMKRDNLREQTSKQKNQGKVVKEEEENYSREKVFFYEIKSEREINTEREKGEKEGNRKIGMGACGFVK